MQGGAEHSGNCTQRSYPLVLEAESDQLCVPALFVGCIVNSFVSRLICMLQDSVPVGSLYIMIHSYLVWFLWWLRHGAIGPSEATSSVGLMSTDLTSEFTYFKLVIRLSKVQQSALRFFAIWRLPAAPAAPGIPVICSFKWSRAELQKPFILQQFYSDIASCHDRGTRQVHDFQVWSLFFWLSGEVKHIVHLIRWNLKAVLCQLGQELNTVPVQGIIARHLSN